MVSHELQSAYACQCQRLSPDSYYEMSDVIFLGRVMSVESAPLLEVGSTVTFSVVQSWKGVDTRFVTIHTGDGTSCGSYPFRADDPDREYLVFASKSFYEIRVTLCGGTIASDASGADPDMNSLFHIGTYLDYFENNFEEIELTSGHTSSVSLVPALQILASFTALAVAAFIITSRR